MIFVTNQNLSGLMKFPLSIIIHRRALTHKILLHSRSSLPPAIATCINVFTKVFDPSIVFHAESTSGKRPIFKNTRRRKAIFKRRRSGTRSGETASSSTRTRTREVKWVTDRHEREASLPNGARTLGRLPPQRAAAKRRASSQTILCRTARAAPSIRKTLNCSEEIILRTQFNRDRLAQCQRPR